MQRTLERARIIDACADAVITRGYGAVTMSLVQHEIGLARDQLYRSFRNKNELLAEVYRRGHHLSCAPCLPTPPTSSPHICAPRISVPRESTSREWSLPGPSVSRTLDAGVVSPLAMIDDVRVFATAVIESAASNPMVQAAHALELSPVAATTGLPSIYRVWEHWLTATLDTSDPPRTGGAGGPRIAAAADLAGALVDALAGTIATTGRAGTGHHTSGGSIDLILQSLPALSNANSGVR
ncbi:TetR/AcrR family transcriptional regulator [Rhodococcus sp. 06-156-3C]|uniref:TetR/AcrR family transcriptional regulator n=1 Tax=Nocardiaceae TaxID=85025 RepID=UPI0005230966|nr:MULTISPECIES: TetR/AcrR family transcriptional regulator [Rhodococcus]OZD12993.1 TetR/AcrR family transcriptional regulator [Rhodococcus sp. 06-156-4a]OZD17861.1 TetR/AcrR family transcriptional regulator [Rhodococcus sp. 06-156-3C]OZD20587.1 TetR/AcrR family transcriptional regulator [Rhodococcus sp. 06-156-4C]OZD30695.1 TetR/AcrR family transcriptional regulator [Rhodococcus sp. 06-156-3b]OZD32531.1 TetR/AcrR family transcriptional regulator [Rhodococcus sp. 06-156-3]